MTIVNVQPSFAACTCWASQRQRQAGVAGHAGGASTSATPAGWSWPSTWPSTQLSQPTCEVFWSAVRPTINSLYRHSISHSDHGNRHKSTQKNAVKTARNLRLNALNQQHFRDSFTSVSNQPNQFMARGSSPALSKKRCAGAWPPRWFFQSRPARHALLAGQWPPHPRPY